MENVHKKTESQYAPGAPGDKDLAKVYAKSIQKHKGNWKKLFEKGFVKKL